MNKEKTKAQLKQEIQTLESDNAILMGQLRKAAVAMRRDLPEEDKEILRRMKQKTWIERKDTLNVCHLCGAWQHGNERPNFCHACGHPFTEAPAEEREGALRNG